MSDALNPIFQFLEKNLGLQPAGVASIAFAIILLLVIVALYLYSRLHGARGVIAQLGDRLGYEPPYGDGKEILDQEFQKEAVESGREKKIEQLEQRILEMENEAESKDASLASLQKRAKEFDDQLQQASLRNRALVIDSEQQLQAHQTAVEELERRMHEMETESNANLAALQQRARELVDQLHQASLRNDELTTQAGEHAKAYLVTVDQLEQRLNEMEAESNASLAAHQEHAKNLEGQLQQATLCSDQISAKAAEQAQAHSAAIEQYEQRIREAEAASAASLGALQQRTRDLEEQVQQVTARHDQVLEQSGEQSQALHATIAQLEQRLRDMEGESTSILNALQLRTKDLESQLRQSYLRHEQVATQADEQAQAHRSAVEQFQQRIHELEAQGNEHVTSLEQHARDLEDQLQQAAFRHEKDTAQAHEAAHHHRAAIGQLEERIQAIDAERNANISALQRHAREVEGQLELATRRHDEIAAQANEQAQAHRTTVEQFQQRIREMEVEHSSNLASVQQHASSLEAQLHQANNRPAPEIETASKADGATTAQALMQRADWITARTVGSILPHGLVAAEAYAAAALAADPQNLDAPQLLAELARIRRAYSEGLPPVTEAVTTFDGRAASFLAADPAAAAAAAESEAHRRARAGMNRSALLATNLAIDLHQQAEAEDSPSVQGLHELKETLLARLAGNANS
jgi:myosin heavy subunit